MNCCIERYTEIERENRILLEKMTHILQNPKGISNAKTIGSAPSPRVINAPRNALHPKAARTAAATAEATKNGLGSAASKLSKSVLSKVFTSKNAEKVAIAQAIAN